MREKKSAEEKKNKREEGVWGRREAIAYLLLANCKGRPHKAYNGHNLQGATPSKLMTCSEVYKICRIL